MRNYKQNGAVLPLVAAVAVASGEPMLKNAAFGVANNSAAIGEEFGLVLRGVFELDKVSAEAWAKCEKLYWDDTAKLVTTVDTDNTLIGFAWDDAADPSDSGTVCLTGVLA